VYEECPVGCGLWEEVEVVDVVVEEMLDVVLELEEWCVSEDVLLYQAFVDPIKAAASNGTDRRIFF